jgi:hypothetical protein
VLQAKVEHANGRRVHELRRRPEPGNQSFPAARVAPRGGEVPNLDFRLAIVGERPIGNSVSTSPKLGKQPVSVETHRAPRSHAPRNPWRQHPAPWYSGSCGENIAATVGEIAARI